MAELLLSVPQLVKMISRGSALIRVAILARALEMASPNLWPKEYALEGLPQFSVRNGSMASTTSEATRVVALLSR